MSSGKAPPDAPGATSPHRRALLALAEKYRVPAFDLEVAHFSLAPLELIPRAVAENHRCLPVQLSGGLLFVAMTDPTAQEVIDELSALSGKRVFSFACEPEALLRAIDDAYCALAVGVTHYSGSRATPGATSAMTSNAVIPPPMFGASRQAEPVDPVAEKSAPPLEAQSKLLRFDQLSDEDV